MGLQGTPAVKRQTDDDRDFVGETAEKAVGDRYTRGAQLTEQELCCPVNYDPQYLAVLPPEILQRDYGCGDPTGFVRSGDFVLDLGSGGGKVCCIAAQIVGSTGGNGNDCRDDRGTCC